jgi:aromatic-L-amino-acid decarboxylase
VRRDIDLARRLADQVRAHPRLELAIEPTLSICCFRYVADVPDLDKLNAAVLRRLHLETPYLPSSTRVKGVLVLRPCFINPRTPPDMVDAFAEAVVAIGDELAAEHHRG